MLPLKKWKAWEKILSNWMKYTFVCDPNECDALLEFTARDGFDFPNGVVQITCPCGRQMSLISANIEQQEEKEGTPMETQDQSVPMHYNPNQLVTYKVIDGETVTYPTDKVTVIEYALESARRTADKRNALQSKINQIIDNLTSDYWYSEDVEKEQVLSDLCEILEHNPVKNIDFVATVTINGSIEIPMDEVADFELSDYVYENLSIDTQTGSMYINDFDVDQVDEC